MRHYSLSTVILLLNVSFLFLNFCLFVLHFEFLRFSLFEQKEKLFIIARIHDFSSNLRASLWK